MNNFNDVFNVIKKNCRPIGVPNASCYEKIVEMLAKKDGSFSAGMYLLVLHDLRLINFNTSTKEISLTLKGTMTSSLFDLKPPVNSS